MKYSSVIFEKAIAQFSTLPGVGKKTALRFILHLLKKKDQKSIEAFIHCMEELNDNICFCSICNNIADTPICSICNDKSRNHELLCVVENIRDVIAIENTDHYNGVYHILGALISPLDGIGPKDLHIESLLKRCQNNPFKEIVFALNATMQGDTTIFYIRKILPPSETIITSISRGVAFGGELEYADDLTLARSLEGRMPIGNYVK